MTYDDLHVVILLQVSRCNKEIEMYYIHQFEATVFEKGLVSSLSWKKIVTSEKF